MTPFPLGFPVIERQLRKNHFDVVHIQEPGSLGVSALLAAKLFGVPTVGALHFTPDQTARLITGGRSAAIELLTEGYIRCIYNLYTAIMVPTQTFAKFLHGLGVTRPVHVVSNGVDTDLFTPARKKSLHKDITTFLYLGRIDKDKNVKTVVSAMRYTKPGVRLIIAGNGKEKESLIAYAKKLSVDQKILWKGTVSQQQMIKLYQAVDGFTIMAEYEIQSIVTLQALASGLPVLLARAGALPELVKEGENGYLIEPHDVKKLAEKMNYLADHPLVRQRMGEESRKISLAHHKPVVLKRLEDLYKQVQET